MRTRTARGEDVASAEVSRERERETRSRRERVERRGEEKKRNARKTRKRRHLDRKEREGKKERGLIEALATAGKEKRSRKLSRLRRLLPSSLFLLLLFLFFFFFTEIHEIASSSHSLSHLSPLGGRSRW